MRLINASQLMCGGCIEQRQKHQATMHRGVASHALPRQPTVARPVRLCIRANSARTAASCAVVARPWDTFLNDATLRLGLPFAARRVFRRWARCLYVCDVSGLIRSPTVTGQSCSTRSSFMPCRRAQNSQSHKVFLFFRVLGPHHYQASPLSTQWHSSSGRQRCRRAAPYPSLP